MNNIELYERAYRQWEAVSDEDESVSFQWNGQRYYSIMKGYDDYDGCIQVYKDQYPYEELVAWGPWSFEEARRRAIL
jgi:hypothetical protein